MDGGALGLDSWEPFFTTAAGASAALVGLIIVAMSVNVETIVGVRSLPARAISTIASLTYVVIASVFALVPHLQSLWFGMLLMLAALPAIGLAVNAGIRVIRDGGGEDHRVSAGEVVGRAVVGLVPVLLALVAGVLVAVGAESGLLLLAVTFVLVFITSVLSAWVLLIEIRR